MLIFIAKCLTSRFFLRSQNKNNVNNEGSKSRFFCDAPLKIIVMSATLDAEKFAAYFKYVKSIF